MEKYISKKEKASYGFAAVGSYMVAGITQSYLMYFFTDILIIPSAFVMMLMIVARVWDALNDPMMGVIVDRTSTKYGKMRPYVLIGSFLMLVTTIVLFMPLTGASTMFKMIFAAVSYIIFGMAYTLTDVPAMGLMSVATPNGDERASTVTGLFSLVTIIPGIGFLLSLIPICFYDFSGVKKGKILSELAVKRKAIKNGV